MHIANMLYICLYIDMMLQTEAELITEDGEEKSSFFAEQMYRAGLTIVPYPPLANEKFFEKLNTEIEPAVDDIEV